MFSKIATRFALIAAGAIGVVGLSGAAEASTAFTNITSQPLVFSVACAADTVTQDWTVAPHSTRSLSCNNGASSMQLTVRTQHGNGDEVVRGTVLDGHAYDLGYDDDGDVSFVRHS